MGSLTETPPTGEPDAGEPLVRFGGEGWRYNVIPPPILISGYEISLTALIRESRRGEQDALTHAVESVGRGRRIEGSDVLAVSLHDPGFHIRRCECWVALKQ